MGKERHLFPIFSYPILSLYLSLYLAFYLSTFQSRSLFGLQKTHPLQRNIDRDMISVYRPIYSPLLRNSLSNSLCFSYTFVDCSRNLNNGKAMTSSSICVMSSSSLLSSSSSTVDNNNSSALTSASDGKGEEKKKKRFLNTTSPFILKETGTLMKDIQSKYVQHMNALAKANKAWVAEKELRSDEVSALESVVSKERERAEKAEATVKEYQSKIQLMNDVWAKETTRLEREVDMYQTLSLNNSTNLYIVEQQILAAKEILIPMLGSSQWLAARKSAELLQVLNLLDDDEILRLTELQRMRKEEEETRFYNAIFAIREDIKLAAKKAKKGKKGKKGKGKGKKGKNGK